MPDWHLWDRRGRNGAPLRPRAAPCGRTAPTAAAADGHAAAETAPRCLLCRHTNPRQKPGRQPPGPGIEPKLRQRLGRGRDQIDGTLDLHGMRQDEAYAALTRFIHARSARGDRTLLVITGKGLKKVNGDDAAVIVERGVLRAMLPMWLTSPELAPLVAGWDQSAQSHGGEGAWYVRLRRQEQR